MAFPLDARVLRPSASGSKARARLCAAIFAECVHFPPRLRHSRLDARRAPEYLQRMLQRNTEAQAQAGAARQAKAAHAAHAMVVGAHVLCCGVPLALMLAAAGAGASIGVSAIARYFAGAHELIHAYELWILAASAVFVMLGGWLEWRAHRGRRVSALFVVSLLCFALNAGVIWSHQDAHAAEAHFIALD